MLIIDTLAMAVQFEYIHGFYNSVRPHSHNNILFPDQVKLFFLDAFLSTFLTMINSSMPYSPLFYNKYMFHFNFKERSQPYAFGFSLYPHIILA